MTRSLPEPLAGEVDRLGRAFSGAVALWVHDLERAETYGLRSDERFESASIIKLFVLLELFRQIETGIADLMEEVVMRSEDVVPGTGVLKDLRPGIRLRLEDAATLMVTVSDNVAANLVIDRVGVEAINRNARDAGFASTHLAGKLYEGRGGLSTTTPRDAGTLMLQVARGEAVSPAASASMLRILRRSQSKDIVTRLLPRETGATGDAGRRLTIASKNGSVLGVRHDVAYVEGPGTRYVVALMSCDCDDARFSVDNEAVICLARLARAVYDHVTRQSPDSPVPNNPVPPP